MDNNNFNADETASLLKHLSIQDFLDVGLNQVAYIKRQNDNQNQELFSIHAADGSQISVMDTYDLAVATIRVNDLHPVTVH